MRRRWRPLEWMEHRPWLSAESRDEVQVRRVQSWTSRTDSLSQSHIIPRKQQATGGGSAVLVRWSHVVLHASSFAEHVSATRTCPEQPKCVAAPTRNCTVHNTHRRQFLALWGRISASGSLFPLHFGIQFCIHRKVKHGTEMCNRLVSSFSNLLKLFP